MKLRAFFVLLLMLTFKLHAASPPGDHCEAKLVPALPESREEVFSALEEKLHTLTSLLKRHVDARSFVKTLTDIQNTAVYWVRSSQNPTDAIFTNWMQDYSLQAARAFEQFCLSNKTPLNKKLAQELLDQSSGFLPTSVIRLSVLRFAVSHSSFAALDLERRQKAVLLNEALATAAYLSPHLGFLESFWGDLYLDLHNWNYLAAPSPSDLIEKVNRVVGQSLDYVSANQLSAPQMRFFADAIALLPESAPGPQLSGILILVRKHSDQLQRRMPKLYHRFDVYVVSN